MSQEFKRDLLVGQWYRSDELDDGRRYCELATIKESGEFEFNFVTYSLDGKVTEDVIEYGLWGLVGNVHFTITQAEGESGGPLFQSEPSHEDNYHAYIVIVLSEDEFQYQHISSGESYTLSKIKGD